MKQRIIGQVLQKGIEAHKAGKVQEADRYYTTILKANPKHPDLGNLIEEDMMQTLDYISIYGLILGKWFSTQENKFKSHRSVNLLKKLILNYFILFKIVTYTRHLVYFVYFLFLLEVF